jgi:hypothetical protein
MGKNYDHIVPEAEGPSRTLDSTKPMYDLGSRIGCYKLLSVPAAEGMATANGVQGRPIALCEHPGRADALNKNEFYTHHKGARP